MSLTSIVLRLAAVLKVIRYTHTKSSITAKYVPPFSEQDPSNYKN